MEQKALPEVCHIQYGYPFDSKRFSDKEGFPLIRIRDVVRGHTETFTTESCNDEYIVKKGDILLEWMACLMSQNGKEIQLI